MRWHRASNTANVTNSFHLDIQRCLSKLGTKKKNPDIDIVTFFMAKNYFRKLSAAIFFQAQNFGWKVRSTQSGTPPFPGAASVATLWLELPFVACGIVRKWNKNTRTFEDLKVYFCHENLGTHNKKHWQRMGTKSTSPRSFLFTWKNPEEERNVDFSFAILDSGEKCHFSSFSLDHPSPSTGTLCLKLSLHRWKAWEEMKGLLDFHQKNTRKKMFNG